MVFSEIFKGKKRFSSSRSAATDHSDMSDDLHHTHIYMRVRDSCILFREGNKDPVEHRVSEVAILA